jgi:hypothetical protein
VTASVRQEAAQQTLAGSSTTVASPAFGSACLVGSTIEFYALYSGNTVPTEVEDNESQNYSLETFAYSGTDNQTLALYVLQNNQFANALAVTATFASSLGSYLGGWAKELTGVTSSPYQTSASAHQNEPGAGTNAITTGTMTPSAEPALVSAVSVAMFTSLTTGPAAGTGFTLGTKGWTPNGTVYWGASESQHITSTTPLAATATDSDGAADDCLIAGAIYTEAASGPPAAALTITGQSPTNIAGTVLTPDVARSLLRRVWAQRRSSGIYVPA